MINKQAIRKFLDRPLLSFDWIKSSSLSELDSSLKELDSDIDFSSLWAHQKACLLILEEMRRFNLHLDMGAGKTATVLYLLRYLKAKGERPKAIVFVPYLTAVETWVEECAKHAPDLECIPLLGSTVENETTLAESHGDLFVICYQSAVAMLAEPIQGKKRSKKSWTIDPKRVRKVFASFTFLVLDEIHKCKSVTSLTYRMSRTLSSRSEWVIGLTGTPFGKDLTDLWPQFYLIDFGETLGPTLGFYREVFFSKKDNYWGGYKYTFKKRLFSTLKKTIKNSSIRYAIDELHDMPRLVRIKRHLSLPEGAEAYAKESIKKIKSIVTGDKSYRAVESEYLRLRQLSSGFMTLHGEDSTKVQIKFDANPKLEMLQDLIEGMAEDCKMVVFHHFVFTNELISSRLREMKVDHARIWGKAKDPIGQLRKFKNDPTCRVLVINSKSGSSSLNLQIANYIVFFEQPDSAIDRQQAERRVWRPGQDRRVLCYDLLMRGTADEKLWKANREGRNLLRELLDGRTELRA